jgi:hypothetical protein
MSWRDEADRSGSPIGGPLRTLAPVAPPTDLFAFDPQERIVAAVPPEVVLTDGQFPW